MLQFHLNRNPHEQRPNSTTASSGGAGDRYHPRQSSPSYSYQQQHNNWDPRAPSTTASRNSPGRDDRAPSLSTGTPFQIANVKPGEYITVIGVSDGLDLLRVSNLVGTSGSAVGLDTKSDTLSSIRSIPAVSSSRNIFLILTQLPHLHLPRASVDAIIIPSPSTVLNLVRESERPKLFQEFFRVLKPGGRLSASLLMAKNVLPDYVKDSLSRPSGEGTHPSPTGWYEYWLSEAGFADIAMAEVRQPNNATVNPRELARPSVDSGLGGYYPHLGPAYSPSPPPTSSSSGSMHGLEGPGASSMSIHHLTSQSGGGQAASLPPILSAEEQQYGEWLGTYNLHAVRPLNGPV